MLVSNYTWNYKLKYDNKKAINYLYFNGMMPFNSSRKKYSQSVQKTTICNHLRLMYALAWHQNKEVFKLILDCISDSKAIVGYLRVAKQDPNFDSEWWKQERVDPLNPYQEGDDSFFNSKIPFKCKDICKEDLSNAKEYLNEDEIPKIYIAYRKLYHIYLFWNNHPYKDDLCLVTLECVHLRSRLDKRVIKWEE